MVLNVAQRNPARIHYPAALKIAKTRKLESAVLNVRAYMSAPRLAFVHFWQFLELFFCLKIHPPIEFFDAVGFRG
jgi:hypothetical protein